MSPQVKFADVPSDLQQVGLVKFEILASGLRVSDQVRQFVARAKGPIRTRSGASGGLDMILPHDVHVNSPINERFAAQSELLLEVENEHLVVKRGEETLFPVSLQPTPRYYGLHTSDNMPMIKVGQMCSGDRFCYGMTGAFCFFWRSDRRCRFCSIGLNQDKDASQKSVSQMLETLSEAVRDPELPAKHVLIGGGTPVGEDMGAVLAAELCREIKKYFDLSCYVMITAPLRDYYIDLLHDAGADELGIKHGTL